MGTETGDKGEQTLRGLKDTADTELRMSALVCMLASAWLDCATSSIGCCYEPQPLPKIHRYCAVFESPRQCLAGLGDHSLEGLPSLLPHMLPDGFEHLGQRTGPQIGGLRMLRTCILCIISQQHEAEGAWRLFGVLCRGLKRRGCPPHLKVSHTVQQVKSDASIVASIPRASESRLPRF